MCFLTMLYRTVIVKQENVVKTLKKTGNWSAGLENEILHVTSIEEIEEIVCIHTTYI